MVDVTTEGDRLVFVVEGLDKLWSFRSRLELPLAHATSVEHDPKSLAVGGMASRFWVPMCQGCSRPGPFTITASWYFGTCAIQSAQSSCPCNTSATKSSSWKSPTLVKL